MSLVTALSTTRAITFAADGVVVRGPLGNSDRSHQVSDQAVKIRHVDGCLVGAVGFATIEGQDTSAWVAARLLEASDGSIHSRIASVLKGFDEHSGLSVEMDVSILLGQFEGKHPRLVRIDVQEGKANVEMLMGNLGIRALGVTRVVDAIAPGWNYSEVSREEAVDFSRMLVEATIVSEAARPLPVVAGRIEVLQLTPTGLVHSEGIDQAVPDGRGGRYDALKFVTTPRGGSASDMVAESVFVDVASRQERLEAEALSAWAERFGREVAQLRERRTRGDASVDEYFDGLSELGLLHQSRTLSEFTLLADQPLTELSIHGVGHDGDYASSNASVLVSLGARRAFLTVLYDLLDGWSVRRAMIQEIELAEGSNAVNRRRRIAGLPTWEKLFEIGREDFADASGVVQDLILDDELHGSIPDS